MCKPIRCLPQILRGCRRVANSLFTCRFEMFVKLTFLLLVQLAGLDPLRDGRIASAGALKAAELVNSSLDRLWHCVPTTLKVHEGAPLGSINIMALQATTNYYKNVVD